MEREIEASTKVRATVERAHDVIVGDPGRMVADECSPDERRERRFHTTLGVDAGPGCFDQEIVVELGPARSTEEAVIVDLHWQAAGRQPAVPAFDGELEVRRDSPGSRLELHGTYHVPSGPEATFGQALAERRLARQSLAAFLEQAARRLDDEVDRHADAVPVDGLVHAVTLREARSEHYIG